MAGQVGGQQVSREELRARGRYSLTIACLFLLILVGAALMLPAWRRDLLPTSAPAPHTP